MNWLRVFPIGLIFQRITQWVKPLQGPPFRLACVFVGLVLLGGWLYKLVDHASDAPPYST